MIRATIAKEVAVENGAEETTATRIKVNLCSRRFPVKRTKRDNSRGLRDEATRLPCLFIFVHIGCATRVGTTTCFF